MKINFKYNDFPSVEIPDENFGGIYQPHTYPSFRTEEEVIQQGLNNPIGLPKIREIAKKGQKVLILIDDYTRATPAEKILPFILKELRAAYVEDKNISLLVAQGTHRKMSTQEKENKVGKEIYELFPVIDHLWENEEMLEYLGDTPSGTSIWINREVLKADLVIGLGHIVPHRITGFSGGGKIIQPGVCGEKTTGQTHWMGAMYEGSEILGKIENPERAEIDEIAIIAGLDIIVNAVQDGSGKIVRLVCGDVIKAHRKGCEIARQVYGVPLPGFTDIVLTDSYPADVDLWQAVKGLFAADIAVREGGVIILVTPCPEGVASHHPSVVNHKCLPFKDLEPLVKRGEFKDLTAAAFLAYVGNIMAKNKCILVSKGINAKTAEGLGFLWAKTPQDALKISFDLLRKNPEVVVFKQGGEILPIIENKKGDK